MGNFKSKAMKKTVVSYLTSVPRGNTNVQKEELLIKYYNGVLRSGDNATLHRDYFPIDCDAAVIQGWVYSDTNPSHLQLRKKVINHQIQNNRYTIVADAVPAPPKPLLAVVIVACELHALPSYNSVKLDPAPGGVLPPAIIKKVDVPFLLAATPNPLGEDKSVPAVQEVPS